MSTCRMHGAVFLPSQSLYFGEITGWEKRLVEE